MWKFVMAVAGIAALGRGELALDVRQYGAAGDGVTNDTRAIQQAIDEAGRRGGATVSVPAGRYRSGTLQLRNRIRVVLEPGAVLLMSSEDGDFADFEPPPPLLSRRVTRYAFSTRGLARAANLPPSEDDSETTYMRYALLLGEEVSDVVIEGAGLVDGNRSKRGGPKPLAFKNCRNVRVRDITIANSPNYAISLLGTDYVTIDNVRIVNGYADGIDPDNCHFVRIANSYIESWDDGICPKASLALGRRRSTEHLTVTNCIVRTACSAFKFGTESAGDLRHVTVSNLTLLPMENARRAPISGIALESVDGANIEAVTVSNIVMRDVRTPIFLRLGARGRGMDEPKPGTLRDVMISNVVAVGAKLASSLTAVPGAVIENVTLANVQIRTDPGEGRMPSLEVPEEVAKYPEATMFGDLPASGLYVRRARGLRLVDVSVETPRPVARPALVLDNIRDAAIARLHASLAGQEYPLVWGRDWNGVRLSETLVAEGTHSLLRLSGTQNASIAVSGSDWRRVRFVVDPQTEQAAHGAVQVEEGTWRRQ